MKSFVAFLAVALCVCFAQAGEQEILQRRNAVIEKCQKELNFDKSVSQVATTKVLAKNENEKCFLECLYKNMGIIKDGKLNVEGAKQLVITRFETDQSMIAKVEVLLNKCKADTEAYKGTEKCAHGRIIRNCFISYGADIPFFTQ